jgi:hypothetical protein
MRAGEILQAADKIVGGARQTTHGKAERSFTAIAGLWNAYIQARKLPHAALEDFDVAHMMQLLKIARALQGDAAEPDHAIDNCGYGALAGELMTKAVKPKEAVVETKSSPGTVEITTMKSGFSALDLSSISAPPPYNGIQDITKATAILDSEKLEAEKQLSETLSKGLEGFVGHDPKEELPRDAKEIEQDKALLTEMWRKLRDAFGEDAAMSFCEQVIGRNTGAALTTAERRLLVQRIGVRLRMKADEDAVLFAEAAQ